MVPSQFLIFSTIFLILPKRYLQMCTYHNLVKYHYRPVICSNMSLDDFIQEIKISEIDTILTLENINFRELRSLNNFPYGQVKLLTISGNDWQIRDDAFKKFNYLYSLQILNSNLSEKHFDGFEINDNFELERMKLSNNNISSLGNVCEKNPYLKTLHIIDNKIRAVEAGTFYGCTLMVDINLSNNRIEFIETGSFNLRINRLNLKNNNLTHVLRDAFSDLPELTDLDLTGNKILSVSTDAFKSLTKLETLILNNNYIQTIEKNTFNETIELLTLELANNKLRRLEPRVFDNLINLEELNLNNNPIQKLEANTFAGLMYLDTLNLTNLQLERFEVGAFHYLENLRHLRLDFNRLTDLDSTMFQLIKTLDTLNLSYNEIDYLGNLTFSNLMDLKVLDLSHNEVRHLDCEMTNTPLLFLEELDFGYNNIHTIDVCAFIHFGNLSLLNLEHNNLTNIVIGTFTPLHQLAELSLAYNKLFNLESTLLFPLSDLQLLDVSGNSLNNWDIEPAVSYLVNIQHIDVSENDWICENLIKTIKFFTDKDIDCSPRKDPVLHEQNVNGIRCSNLPPKFVDFENVGSGSNFSETVRNVRENENIEKHHIEKHENHEKYEKREKYGNHEAIPENSQNVGQLALIISVLVSLIVSCGLLASVCCIKVIRDYAQRQRENILSTVEHLFHNT